MPAKHRPIVSAPPPPLWASPQIVPVALLIFAVFAVYTNSVNAPFIFDDRAAILDNASIRRLWPLADVLSPPAGGLSVSGRPLLNLSLAINYAIGGTSPWSYHLFNILIHLLAGLVLFDLVRRAWSIVAVSAAQAGEKSDASAETGAALFAAFAVALLWLLHPLQTAAVTYVVQRAEVLMGLFYLLTLYGFIRGVGIVAIPCGATSMPDALGSTATARSVPWLAGSVVACVCGMATKETMVTAPLIVLLFDRTFVAGSFASAWRLRRGYYFALAATWLVFAWLFFGTGGRGGTVGFDAGISWWRYLLTQCEAVVQYLQLSVWPHPLVFDRGEYLVADFSDVWPEALFVVTLLAGTIFALRRHPVPGFLAAAFFIVLAPTSSVVPIASQTIAEHRMYLPLAPIAVAIIWTICRVARPRVARWLVLLLAVFAGGLTIARNRTYASEIALWENTVRHAPANARAQSNLGSAYLESGRDTEALAAFREAARLQPASAEIHLNLCHAYTRLGRLAEAVSHGERAVQLAPDEADAHVNLAAALVRRDQLEAAIEHYAAAHRLQPDAADIRRMLADARIDRGKTLARRGAWEEARQQIAEALRVAPDHVEAHFSSGNLAAAQNNFPDAIAAYERALALDSEHVGVRNNLANALLVSGRTSAAIEQYREVLRRRPGDESVRANLQRALQQSGPATPTR